jgi:large subunit ribosomal protein L6
MSRIGKNRLSLPDVAAFGFPANLSVRSKGTRNFKATDDVTLSVDDGSVSVVPRGNSKRARQWLCTHADSEPRHYGVTAGFKAWGGALVTALQIRGNVLKLNLDYTATIFSSFLMVSLLRHLGGRLSSKVSTNNRSFRLRRTSASKHKPYRAKGIRYAGAAVFFKEAKVKDRTDGKRKTTVVHQTPAFGTSFAK